MENNNQIGKIVSSDVGEIEIPTDELADSLQVVHKPRATREQRPQVKLFPGQTNSLLIPKPDWRA